jgi:hypothetical protein
MTEAGGIDECPSNLDVGMFLIFILAILSAIEVHINPLVYKIHNFPDCLQPIFGITVRNMNALSPFRRSFYASLTSMWFTGIPVVAILGLLWLSGWKQTWPYYQSSFITCAICIVLFMLYLYVRGGGIISYRDTFKIHQAEYAIFISIAMLYILVDMMYF